MDGWMDIYIYIDERIGGCVAEYIIVSAVAYESVH